jgi:hypothetical protein
MTLPTIIPPGNYQIEMEVKNIDGKPVKCF